MALIPSTVKLLLHCNGANGSTTITDETGKTVSPGSANISTAQSVFGGASLYSSGAGNGLSLADNADWDFFAQNTSIDFRVRPDAITRGEQLLIGQLDGSGYAPLRLGLARTDDSQAKIQAYVQSSSGTWGILPVTTGSPIKALTWAHIAVGFTKSSNNLRVYADGAKVIDATVTSYNSSSPNPLIIGGSGSYKYAGFIDEVRIDIGADRFTGSTIAVPTEPYYGYIDNAFSGTTKRDGVGVSMKVTSFRLSDWLKVDEVMSSSSGVFALKAADYSDHMVICQDGLGRSAAYITQASS